MSVGLHMRLTGRPGRAAGLARFLDFIAQREAVWVCRRLDIARHWSKHPSCRVTRITPGRDVERLRMHGRLTTSGGRRRLFAPFGLRHRLQSQEKSV